MRSCGVERSSCLRTCSRGQVSRSGVCGLEVKAAGGFPRSVPTGAPQTAPPAPLPCGAGALAKRCLFMSFVHTCQVSLLLLCTGFWGVCSTSRFLQLFPLQFYEGFTAFLHFEEIKSIFPCGFSHRLSLESPSPSRNQTPFPSPLVLRSFNLSNIYCPNNWAVGSTVLKSGLAPRLRCRRPHANSPWALPDCLTSLAPPPMPRFIRGPVTALGKSHVFPPPKTVTGITRYRSRGPGLVLSSSP